jgi:Protein of unknown function (DUF229)
MKARRILLSLGTIVILVCMANFLLLLHQNEFLPEDEDANQHDHPPPTTITNKQQRIGPFRNLVSERYEWKQQQTLQKTSMQLEQQQPNLQQQTQQHGKPEPMPDAPEKNKQQNHPPTAADEETQTPRIEPIKKQVQKASSPDQQQQPVLQLETHSNHKKEPSIKVPREKPPQKKQFHNNQKPIIVHHDHDNEEDPMAVLNYAPSRIPGYINVYGKDTMTLYGHVMRELIRRICARQIAQSTIVVMAPESPAVVQQLWQLQQQQQHQNKSTSKSTTNQQPQNVVDTLSLRRHIQHAVGGSTLIDVHQQGHTYFGLNITTTPVLNDWWTSFDNDDHSSSSSSSEATTLAAVAKKPSWILLAMFDHGKDNDPIIHQSLLLLKEATVTYIVLGIGAYPNGTMYGQDAIQDLIHLKYKVMILSVSHLPKEEDGLVSTLLRPNADVTLYRLSPLFQGMQTLAKSSGTPVLGYVFATQGLDLAIPTAMEYDPVLERNKKSSSSAGGIKYKQCPSSSLQLKFPPSSQVLLQMVGRLSSSSRGFFSGTNRRQQQSSQQQQQQQKQQSSNHSNSISQSTMWISCQTKRMDPSDPAYQDLWYSGETMETSEAVCLRAHCVVDDQATCTTRILPKDNNNININIMHTNNKHTAAQKRRLKKPISTTTTTTTHTITGDENNKRPNLLLLMIDPISRARLERSLPKTNRLLQLLEFTSFSQYTAVGNNSGPNQAALYSGIPLASRDSIATHGQNNNNATTKDHHPWLWDTLRDHGYATFKAEDGCVENSNMIQSIRPQVDHGDALLQMMCFDFQRPNCVGDKAAAQHLIDYGTQFIQTYEQRNQPWAALLHFIDSHEDTQTLEGTLDDPIWHFFFSIYEAKEQCSNKKASIPCSVWDNTLIVFLSDHGLHYGSYLLSPKGLKERSQPMLHMHLPKSLASASATLEANQALFATPFDLHATLLEALVPEARHPDTVGSSLLQPLPATRKACTTTSGVPSYVCDLLSRNDETTNVMMPNPPSVMSFYADMPRTNKQVAPPCNAKPSNATIFNNDLVKCFCATNLRPWYMCSVHPWAKPSSSTRKETFSLVDCQNDLSFEIQVQRDPTVLSRPEVLKARSSASDRQSKPNILFLEIDSVSVPYADRHFPRTRELLHSLRLRQSDKDPSGFTCNANETVCSAEFEAFSVVGASSIPNQIAAFGGCVVTVGPERCGQLVDDDQSRVICANSSHPVYQMELVKDHQNSATFCRVDDENRSPWIFDVAHASGYVSLFAEEFCFQDSVYVPQGNIFPLDNVDILPSNFFCRVTERRAAKYGSQLLPPLWKYEYSPKVGFPTCVDSFGGYERGRVALDHIETMWDAYNDVPKFAYVNAIAAHVYSEFKV